METKETKKKMLYDLMKAIVQCSTRDNIKDTIADREALETIISLFTDMDFEKAKDTISEWRREKISFNGIAQSKEAAQPTTNANQSNGNLRLSHKTLIDYCCKETGIRKMELARRLNIRSQTLNDWTRRYKNMSTRTLYIVLDNLNYDIVIRNRVTGTEVLLEEKESEESSK